MIEIQKKSDDGLTVEMWRFSLIGNHIVLDEYCKMTRPTRRHKGKVASRYNRLVMRESTLAEADVPWSTDIAEEAMRLYVATLRVVRLSIDCGRKRGKIKRS
jgi:hypothetical protein